MSDMSARIAEILNRNAEEAASELLGVQTSNQLNDLEHRTALTMAKLLEAKHLVDQARPQLFIELHENKMLVEVHYERRTWRERLLSLTPWKRTRRVYLPDPHIYKYPAAGLDRYQVEFWVAHPETAAKVRAAAKEHGVEL